MVRDVPIELDLESELGRQRDRKRLREFFRDWELRDPLRRLEEALEAAEAEAIPRPRPRREVEVPVRRAAVGEVARLRATCSRSPRRRPRPPRASCSRARRHGASAPTRAATRRWRASAPIRAS
jgi:hypothetical protein